MCPIEPKEGGDIKSEGRNNIEIQKDKQNLGRRWATDPSGLDIDAGSKKLHAISKIGERRFLIDISVGGAVVYYTARCHRED
jgi:hypothetical protein